LDSGNQALSGIVWPVFDDLLEAERALLGALSGKDYETLAGMLDPDFLITTAGWISEPADKATWLAGFAENQLELEKFDVNLIAERRYEEIAVALVESEQEGTRKGDAWKYTFRYTDVLDQTNNMAAGCSSCLDRQCLTSPRCQDGPVAANKNSVRPGGSWHHPK
jgi:hypothetical protein